MILLHRHRFGIAEYYRQAEPEQAKDALARGLVVPVELSFQLWLGGRRLRADAFLDPGADQTMISMRWISDQARAAGLAGLVPQADPRGFLVESIEVTIGGYRTQPLRRVEGRGGVRILCRQAKVDGKLGCHSQSTSIQNPATTCDSRRPDWSVRVR